MRWAVPTELKKKREENGEQEGTSELGSYGSCDVNSVLKPTATLG